jgi:hypothetical protein
MQYKIQEYSRSHFIYNKKMRSGVFLDVKMLNI